MRSRRIRSASAGRKTWGSRARSYRGVERYEHARTQLERVRRELGLNSREEEPVKPIRLPSEYARLFGEGRAASLEQGVAAAIERAQGMTDDELLRATATSSTIPDLDRRAAGRTIRLEREHAHHKEAAQKQAARATELEARSATLRRRDRRERDQLRCDAALHRQHAERHASDVERIELELQRLHAAGRHPDQWLQRHGAELVAQLAAAAELEHRRDRKIALELERAVIRPPERLRDVIGERPAAGTKLVEDWERLARRIERHRLTYEFHVDHDGSLGPDPSQIRKDQRVAYEEQRRALAEDVGLYRESLGLRPLRETYDIARGDEHAVGRCL